MRPGTAPILIVAPSGDLHARAVRHELLGLGVPVHCADLQELSASSRLTQSIDGDSIDAFLDIEDGARVALSEMGTIWWRRPRPPVISERFEEPTSSFVADEWQHFLEGLEAVVPVRWVNPPAANRRASRKTFGLVAAVQENLRVPRTAITNDSAAVRELLTRDLPLIYKRIGAKAAITATMPLERGDIERLDTLVNCPAIFQERITAQRDIRVTAFGEELHAAEIDSQEGDGALDWRLDHTVGFRPHDLDERVADALLGVMRRLHLAFAAFDLRLTPAGEYVFLEVNPSGQFLFLELLAGMPLARRMAEFLCGC